MAAAGEFRKLLIPLPLPPSLDTPEFRAAWQEWIDYRKERRLAAWQTRTIVAKLIELEAVGSKSAIAAIRKSISNGWQGIFAATGSTPVPAAGQCNRCEGKGYVEKPIPGSFGRDTTRAPCSRCQGTGRF